MGFINPWPEHLHFSACLHLHFIAARGAPHLHSLLWLVDSDGQASPTFWSTNELNKSKLPEEMKDCLKEEATKNPVLSNEEKEARKLQISKIARAIIFGSVDDAKCKEHRVGKCKNHTEGRCDDHTIDKLQKLNNDVTEACEGCKTIKNSDHNNCELCQLIRSGFSECQMCQTIKERVEKYNRHLCTFTCHKKKKTMSIKPDEGHGRLDGKKTGPLLSRIPKCRFNVPFF